MKAIKLTEKLLKLLNKVVLIKKHIYTDTHTHTHTQSLTVTMKRIAQIEYQPLYKMPHTHLSSRSVHTTTPTIATHLHSHKQINTNCAMGNSNFCQFTK